MINHELISQLKSPETSVNKNTVAILTAFEAATAKLSSTGQTKQEVTLQLSTNPETKASLHFTLPNLSELIETPQPNQIQVVQLELKVGGEVIAERRSFFQLLHNGLVMESMNIFVEDTFQHQGLGLGLLSTTDSLIAKILDIFPKTFANTPIISLYEDNESAHWVSEEEPLKKSWGDRMLKLQGYSFNAQDVKNLIPKQTPIEAGYNPELTPYRSRIKAYLPPALEAALSLGSKQPKTEALPTIDNEPSLTRASLGAAIKDVLTAPIHSVAPEITVETERLAQVEVIDGTKFINLSGFSLQEIYHHFPRDMKAEEVVILPDFTPSGDSQRLPTGCCVVIDALQQPEWRKLAISDVGCGMQVIESNLTWSDFEANHAQWDAVATKLRANKGGLGDLGSGNHFVDAVVDSHEKVHFVVHTGSRDESKTVESLVTDAQSFDTRYAQIIQWARANRDTIRQTLESVYGPLKLVTDTTHNFFEVQGNKVTIYKGAVKLSPGVVSVIPSSMDGEMVLVTGKDSIQDLHFATSHGTGRDKSRSEIRTQARQDEQAANQELVWLRQKIYIPDSIKSESLRTEQPSSYRKLDNCLKLLQPYVQVENRLTPIAYLGHL